MSPTLQAHSLPAEPQGKPKNTGVGSLSLLQWICLTQESNQGLLHCRWLLYQLSYQGFPAHDSVSWADCKSNKWSFWSVIFLLLNATTTNHFLIRLWLMMKSDNNHHYMKTTGDRSSGWAKKKLQSTSQIQTYTKRGSWSLFGGLLSIWSTTAFSVSQSVSSVVQLCPTLCDPMNRSMPGLPVHHQLPEFTQTHVHRVPDAIQPSHPLSSPSPPAPNPSQHQSLFQWVNSSQEVAKVLEFQL